MEGNKSKNDNEKFIIVYILYLFKWTIVVALFLLPSVEKKILPRDFTKYFFSVILIKIFKKISIGHHKFVKYFTLTHH